jgi:uncharacterized membrane protein
MPGRCVLNYTPTVMVRQAQALLFPLPRRIHTMNRKVAALAVFFVLFGMACGSMNRVLPSEVDAKAMEADVRSKIAAAVPEKTFAVEVEVDNHAVVTLTGHADNQSDVSKIVDAAKSVSGVQRVINNIHVQ